MEKAEYDLFNTMDNPENTSGAGNGLRTQKTKRSSEEYSVWLVLTCSPLASVLAVSSTVTVVSL